MVYGRSNPKLVKWLRTRPRRARPRCNSRCGSATCRCWPRGRITLAHDIMGRIWRGNNKKRTTLKRCSPGLRRLMRRSRTKTPKIRRLEGGWWDAHRGCWSGLRRTRRPRTKMPKIRRLGRKKAHAHQCMQAPKHLCRAPALRLPVAEHIPPSDQILARSHQLRKTRECSEKERGSRGGFRSSSE